MTENIAWFGQRAHLNDEHIHSSDNKFNTLVAIEVLVESRRV